MVTTSPDAVWSPDPGDDYDLTTDLAATAQSVQVALNKRAGQSGTTAQRTAFGNAGAVTGVTWWDTSLSALFVWSGGAWRRVAPEVDSGWTDITTFGGNASGGTGSSKPQWRKIGSTVYLRGRVNCTASQGVFDEWNACNVSSAASPNTEIVVAVYGSTGADSMRVSISANGNVSAHAPKNGSSTYITLGGITYLAN